MSGQLTTHQNTLRLFFTEDVYLVEEPVFRSDMDAPTSFGPDNSLPEETAVEPGTVQETFDFLGKNQKKILIIVNDPINKVSTEKGSELLRNIVKAINLNANDFALVNYAQYTKASYKEFKSFFSPTLTFCFGVSAADLLLNELSLNEIHILNEARIIFCNNLNQLTDDQQGKKALWSSLKKLNL